MNRRNFLKHLTAAACCGAGAGIFKPRASYAAIQTSFPGKVLVKIELAGGNDPLNSFCVSDKSNYYDLRPLIAIPGDKVDWIEPSNGLNPVLVNLGRLYREGKVAIIRGVGDPKGTRSHFTSKQLQAVGMMDSNDGLGWVGRLVQNQLDYKYPAVSLAGESTLISTTRISNQTLSINGLTNYKVDVPISVGQDEIDFSIHISNALSLMDSEGSARATAAARGLRKFYDSVDDIQNVVQSYNGAAVYPAKNVFSTQMQDAARLVQSDLVNPSIISCIQVWI